MRLTIKNIKNIEGHKLPRHPGWGIGDIEDKGYEYQIGIMKNHTLKMILIIHRDSNFDGRNDIDNYTCTMKGFQTVVGKWVIDREHFKTKLGFSMIVSDMVEKLWSMIEAEDSLQHQILNLHKKIQTKNGV